MSEQQSPRLEIDDLVISPDATVLDALKALDGTGLGTIFLRAKDGKITAVVTNGDIRRYLIRGGELQGPVSDAANSGFYWVGPDVGRAEVATAMMERRFDTVPVCDEEGRLLHVHTLREIVLRKRVDSWAVVMAGGKGERLGEYTQALPKPMLPVGGRPILERIVRQLVSHGFRRIYLSVSYLAQMIEDHFGDGSAFHCEIDYLREEQPLGTGGPLSLLPSPSAPVLVMNGDLLTNLNFGRLLRFHKSGDFAMTVALREHRVSVPYGVADLDERRVVELVEKPSFRHQVNAGVYIVQPDLLPHVPKDASYPITSLVKVCLDRQLPVGGYRMDESWIDIGQPQEYHRAQEE